mgnify:CR=1 FL=1
MSVPSSEVQGWSYGDAPQSGASRLASDAEADENEEEEEEEEGSEEGLLTMEAAAAAPAATAEEDNDPEPASGNGSKGSNGTETAGTGTAASQTAGNAADVADTPAVIATSNTDQGGENRSVADIGATQPHTLQEPKPSVVLPEDTLVSDTAADTRLTTTTLRTTPPPQPQPQTRADGDIPQEAVAGADAQLRHHHPHRVHVQTSMPVALSHTHPSPQATPIRMPRVKPTPEPSKVLEGLYTNVLPRPPKTVRSMVHASGAVLLQVV